MKNTKSDTYYIENLTVDSRVFCILPYFLKNKTKALQETENLYYFNNSKLGLWLGNFTMRFVRKQIKRADFCAGEMHE